MSITNMRYILCLLTAFILTELSRSDDHILAVKTIIISLPQVCQCEYRFNPVCGSDGVTFLNKCLLDCTNDRNAILNNYFTPISVLPHSECSGCVCLNINLPVCSLDGEIYRNECELSCENIKRIREKKPIAYLAYRAACNGPPCICTNIAAPVCGTDNILYRNLCVLDCASANARALDLPPIAFQNYGACLDGCLCPETIEPVCGTDGRIYDNLCTLECKNRKLASSKSRQIGIANPFTCRECACKRKFAPVCGSDGITYINTCEITCESLRRRNPFLHIVSNGVCPKCFCTNEINPVCGTDHKTYNNVCELRCANYGPGKDQHPISVFYRGKCQEYECNCGYCSEEYQPVCGDDRRSYWNLCYLNCNSDCMKERGMTPILLAAKGYCSL